MVYILLDLKLDKQLGIKKGSEEKSKFVIGDIFNILTNKAYIFIALLCVTFYSAVFPFMAFAPDFFYHKFSMSYEKSGQIASLLPLGTLIFTPIFGFLIDRKGKAATAMIFGAFLLLAIHSAFAFTGIQPYVPMILLGISFSLVPAAMWPTTVKLVDDEQIGTAYGLMYSIQNIGLWGFPLIAGIVLDKTNPGNPEILNYKAVMIMFVLLGLAGLIFAVSLKLVDKKGNYGIDIPLNKK